MPSEAISVYNGALVRAHDYTDDEWVRLKANHIVGQFQAANVTWLAYVAPKTSLQGTKFFALVAGESGSAPESIWHKTTKLGVFAILKSFGWQPCAERPGWAPAGKWQADVYVEFGKRKVALEIQHSPQTLDRYLERQAKYRSVGVQAYWLLYPPRYITLAKATGRRRFNTELNRTFPPSGGFWPCIPELPAMFVVPVPDTDELRVNGAGLVSYSATDWLAALVEDEVYWQDGRWLIKS